MFTRVNQTIQAVKRLGQTSLVVNKMAWRWAWQRDQSIPILLRDTMQELGSTYIKLGQLIASSPTLFPMEYVEAFQSCLDQTPAIPFAEIEAILQQQLGAKINHYFHSIERTPLGSASIAQVHGAVLKTGEQVVIKVQKPGVKTILSTDFQFLQFATQLLELLSNKAWKTSVGDIVEEIRNGMLEECDFHKEANNIDEYRAFIERAGISEVVVPKVYHELSTETVLVMERFFGVPLSDTAAVQQLSPDPEFALMQALNTWFMSLQQCQIYHADLHAGNVMMLNDGRIGFIDFGIVGRLSPRTWEGLTSLSVCVPAEDFDGLALALSKIGATKSEIDLNLFANDLRNFWHKLSSDEGFNHDEPDGFWRALTLDLSAISAQHGIRFPREFTLLIKQFLYFDRYIRLLAPEVDLFDSFTDVNYEN